MRVAPGTCASGCERGGVLGAAVGAHIQAQDQKFGEIQAQFLAQDKQMGEIRAQFQGQYQQLEQKSNTAEAKLDRILAMPQGNVAGGAQAPLS